MPVKPYNKYQAEFYGVRKYGEGRANVVQVPEAALADRERRSTLKPRDLTGHLMGDPPIGYLDPLPHRSAISIRHDRLDDLMFGLRA